MSMELQSRSSVRDRLLFSWVLLLHLGRPVRMPSDENFLCEHCSTFFFRLRRDGLQTEAAGYAQSTYLYGYVAAWLTFLHSVRVRFILDASIHVYGRAYNTYLSDCMPTCPDCPYDMQAIHVNTCMACCSDLHSKCYFVLLLAALSSAGSARMKGCGEGESRSQL